MSTMDKIIEDLVKGASRNTRANGGPGVNIVVARENRGREEKLANHAGLGGALAGPIGAAIGADPGQGLSAAGGSLLGGAGGALAGSLGGGGIGALIAKLLGQNALAGGQLGSLIGTGVGGIAGSAYGGHKGGEKDAMFGGAGGPLDPSVSAAHMVHGMGSPIQGGGAGVPHPAAPSMRPQLPRAALDRMHASSPFAAPPKMAAYYDAGVKAAFAQFLPMLARAGAALAPKLLPAAKSVGNFAMTHPVGQQLAGAVGSNLVNKAMTPPQPGM